MVTAAVSAPLHRQREGPVELCLAEAIPAPVEEEHVTVDLDPSGITPFLDLDSSVLAYLSDPGTVPDHVFTTRVALSMVPIASALSSFGSGEYGALVSGEWALAERAHIYTDGSEKDGKSAWAVVCILELRTGFAILGHLSDKVAISSSSPSFVGSSSHSSLDGEISALIWGYTLASNLPEGLPVVVHCDCTSAIASVSRPSINERFHQVATILWVTSQLAAVHRGIEIMHVKGHSGHPWNEYADRAASQVLTSPTGLHCCSHPLSKVASLHPHRLRWACDLVCLRMSGQEYPCMVGNTWYIGPSALRSLPYLDHATSSWRSACPCGEALLSVGQANVLTLHPPHPGPIATSPRMEFLDDAFNNAGLHVVCVQEARTRGPSMRMQKYFMAFTSGSAANGTLGCEVWISKAFPQPGGISKHVDSSSVVVCHTSPRMLLVTLSTPAVKLAVLSAHAPTSGSQLCDIAEFWNEVESALDRHLRSDWPLVVGIDGNAKLGSVVSSDIGPLDADVENTSGSRLRSMASKYNLLVPSTFPKHHSGPSATWQGNAGQAPQRIDYIMVSSPWVSDVSSRVAPEIDITTRRRDHYVVTSTFKFRADPTWCPTRRRSPIASRSAMLCAQAQPSFLRALSMYRSPSWDTHAHDHHHLLFTSARQAAEQTFPLSRALPYKSWLSSSTRALMEARSRSRSTMFSAMREVKLLVKRAVFMAIKLEGDLSHVLFREQVTLLHWTIALSIASLSSTEVEHRKNVETDRALMIEAISVDAAEAACKGDIRAMHTHIKALSPKTMRAQHAVTSVTSSTSTPWETRRAWQAYFLGKLAGIDTTFSSLLEQHSAHQDMQFASTVGSKLSVDELPSITDLYCILCNVRRNRGAGEDALPGELFRVCPMWWAQVLHPVISKAMTRLQEPLSWKGGMLADIWKGSGDRSDPANSRAVLIEDTAAKVYHAWLRRRLLGRYLSTAHDAVYGGVPKRGTEMCSHHSMAFWEYTRAVGMSAAQLYVDIVGAFDAVIRQLVVRSPSLAMDDGGIASIVKALGLPPETMHSIAAELAKPSVLESADVPATLLNPVTQAHTHTWFTSQGLPGIVESRAGSKPGDPLGDIVFNMLEANVHKKLSNALEDHPAILVLPPLPPDLAPHFLNNDPSKVFFNNYVDDDAFCIVSSTALGLTRHVSSVAAVVVRTFMSMGLSLNFKENKSEVVVSMVGPHSREARKRLVADAKSTVTIPAGEATPTSPEISLRVVAWYRHMGICSAASGGLKLEAKARAGSLFTTYRSLRPKVLNNSFLPVHVKLSICQSLLYSRLFYGASLWHDEPQSAVTTLTTAYVAPLRDALGLRNTDSEGKVLPHEDRTTNAQVMVAAEVPTVLGRARAARIKYWCRLVREAPHTLLRLALACYGYAGTWTQSVIEDLHACWTSGSKTLDAFPNPRKHLMPWILAAREGKWLAKRLSVMLLRLHAPTVATETVPSKSPCEIPCPDCGDVFPSFVVMCAHRTAKHNYINPLRLHVVGSECLGCKVQFHSYSRLYDHVRTKFACSDHYFSNAPPMSVPVARAYMTAATVTEKAAKSKSLRCPCIRPS